MTTLGIGLIGCGNISTSYLRLAPLFRGIEMRAVADIEPTAAGARAKEFGVSAKTTEELLGADDIDIIVNLTVPEAHYSVTRRILEAGKHAYSEKPLVLSLEEGEALRGLAAGKGLRVGCAPDTFLGGAHQQARALIDAGDIGRITTGTAHVMGHGMEHWHPNPDFFFLPGAGPVLDIGPYYITNLIQLIGPVKRVAALGNMATDTRTISTEGPRKGEVIPVRTPTSVHALLEFAQGATITLGTSWDVWSHRHGNMELYGTKGAMFLPDPNFFGGTIEMTERDAPPKVIPPWPHPFGKPNESGTSSGRANYRCAGLADMAAAITSGRPHRCGLELALHTVDVMTSILRSAENGTFEELTTTCERPAPLTPDEASALLAERVST